MKHLLSLTVALCALLNSPAGFTADPLPAVVAKARAAFEAATGQPRVEAAAKLLALDESSAEEVIAFLFEYCHLKKTGEVEFIRAVSQASKHALPVLMKALCEDSPKQSLAMSALAKNYDVSRESLEAMLTSDTALHRQRAVHTLARAYPKAAPSTAAVLARLDDDDADVRFHAAKALISMRSSHYREAIAELAEAYTQRAANERQITLQLLTRIGLARADVLPVLRIGLEDGELTNRFISAVALAGTGLADDETLMPIFRAVVADGDPYQQSEAAYRLGRFGSAAKAALPELKLALQAKDVRVRKAAALAIAVIDPDQTEAMLAVVLKSFADNQGWSRHRQATIHGLGELGPAAAAAVPSLENMLQRELEPLRVSMSVSLLKIAPNRPAALNALRDYFAGRAKSYVPSHVFEGVGKASEPLVDDLIRVVKDEQSRTFIPACELLAEIGPAAGRAAPALEQRLTTTTIELHRTAIRQTLAAIRGDKP